MMNVLLRVTAIKPKKACAVTPLTAAPTQAHTRPLTKFIPKGQPIPGTRRGVSIEFVKQVVCESYGISLQEIESDSSKAKVALPRQVAMYLAHTLIENETRRTCGVIGRRFGDRDYKLVMQAIRRIGKRLDTNTDLAARVQALTAIIREEAAKPILKIDVNAKCRL